MSRLKNNAPNKTDVVLLQSSEIPDITGNPSLSPSGTTIANTEFILMDIRFTAMPISSSGGRKGVFENSSE